MLYNSIPVLMYHHVASTDRELNVYPNLFEEQLRALSNNGWKTLSGEEFLYLLSNQKEKPKKCVLLTFDDGFADNYVYAFPLLKKFKMKAMLFIATYFIDDAEVKRDSFVPLSHNDAWRLACTERRSEVMCTWKEMQEMEDSGLVDIESHSHTHKTPFYIMEKRYTELREDLFISKKTIEERLSKEVLHLGWPKGFYDQESVSITTGLGYKALYTTERGTNTAENMKEIRRLPVKKDERWLISRLNIYSSTFLSKLYLSIRRG